MLKLTVGRNGEDYYSIQEALNAIPYNTKGEIVISEGVYNEKIFSDKKDLSLIGNGNVVITYSDSAKEIMPDGLKRGTFRTYTAFFSGERLFIENITIENNAGLGTVVGQAIALYLDVDNARLKDVSLLAHQDTLFLAPLPEKEREKRGFYGPRTFSERKLNRVKIEGGVIKGGIDFIFGGADAYFHKVSIVSNEVGYIAAPSGKKEDLGFVFSECTFTSENLPLGSCYLMRPWREEGKSYFFNCTYGDHINKEGFSPWNDLEDKATFKLDSPIFPSKYRIAEEEKKDLLNKIDSMFL